MNCSVVNGYLLSHRYTVACCHCGHQETSVISELDREFVQRIKKAGWRRIKGVAVCPACVEDKP